MNTRSARVSLLILARYSSEVAAFQTLRVVRVSAASASTSSVHMTPKQKSTWTAADEAQAKEARSKLQVWPLDEYNAALLNQVHPIDFESSEPPHEIYDLIAVGAGAGGLVSSKQAARRGAKSAMISEKSCWRGLFKRWMCTE
mmetsp:Transcript_27011/g.48838  ORF Transcript_27011/g.48838 Transcript_27011/m.48838 type:complete len:143 (-) Transcript_27011:576-1004(-)